MLGFLIVTAVGLFIINALSGGGNNGSQNKSKSVSSKPANKNWKVEYKKDIESECYTLTKHGEERYTAQKYRGDNDFEDAINRFHLGMKGNGGKVLKELDINENEVNAVVTVWEFADIGTTATTIYDFNSNTRHYAWEFSVDYLNEVLIKAQEIDGICSKIKESLGRIIRVVNKK